MGITRVNLLEVNLPISSDFESVFNKFSTSSISFKLYFALPFLST